MRHLALLFLVLSATPAAMAGPVDPVGPVGECRAALRPLLLSPEPDAAALATVRATCQAEADAGDPVALYELALFHLGLNGEWQPEAAIPLIRDAAAAGVPEAQYWLAWQYEAGPLLAHDPAMALGWYQRAANANHRLAVARLARAYEAGELGLARDPFKAAEYKARESQCMRKQAAAAASTGG